MSRSIPRLFSLRFASSTRPAVRSQLPSATLRNTTRRFASGESGPRPTPGQSPFKIWPFVAITLMGTGSYILMVRSRDGSCTSKSFVSIHIKEHGVGPGTSEVACGVDGGVASRILWACSSAQVAQYLHIPAPHATKCFRAAFPTSVLLRGSLKPRFETNFLRDSTS